MQDLTYAKRQAAYVADNKTTTGRNISLSVRSKPIESVALMAQMAWLNAARKRASWKKLDINDSIPVRKSSFVRNASDS